MLREAAGGLAVEGDGRVAAPETLVIDIDSAGRGSRGTAGSAWNGYYHRRVYHPIVAAAGETGDILDLRLREGQVHTADGGLEFVLEVLERGGAASVREGRGALRRGISRRAADGGAGGAGHALCGPGAWATPC